MLARVQPVEVRNAIDTEQHGLAVDHKRAVAVTKRGLRDQRVSARPVMAVAREQPHPPAVALDDQAIAVVFDFVEPFRPVGDLRCLVRNAGFKEHDG